MPVTITFMKITFRAPKALVAKALAKTGKERIILFL